MPSMRLSRVWSRAPVVACVQGQWCEKQAARSEAKRMSEAVYYERGCGCVREDVVPSRVRYI